MLAIECKPRPSLRPIEVLPITNMTALLLSAAAKGKNQPARKNTAREAMDFLKVKKPYLAGKVASIRLFHLHAFPAQNDQNRVNESLHQADLS